MFDGIFRDLSRRLARDLIRAAVPGIDPWISICCPHCNSYNRHKRHGTTTKICPNCRKTYQIESDPKQIEDSESSSDHQYCPPEDSQLTYSPSQDYDDYRRKKSTMWIWLPIVVIGGVFLMTVAMCMGGCLLMIPWKR
jgi:hypothetical protein